MDLGQLHSLNMNVQGSEGSESHVVWKDPHSLLSLCPRSLAEAPYCRRCTKHLGFRIIQLKFSLLQPVSVAPCLSLCTFEKSLAPSCLYHSQNHKSEITEDDFPVASALLQHPKTFCTALSNVINLHPLKFDSFPHLSRERGLTYTIWFVLVV